VRLSAECRHIRGFETRVHGISIAYRCRNCETDAGLSRLSGQVIRDCCVQFAARRRTCRWTMSVPIRTFGRRPGPVGNAAAVLAAGEEDGRGRLRAALQAWPVGLRRGVSARFRRLAGPRRSSAANRSRRRPPASLNNLGASLTNSGLSCLKNCDSESHRPCPEPAAKAPSLINSGRPTFGAPDVLRICPFFNYSNSAHI
jgi:hypothetical protein